MFFADNEDGILEPRHGIPLVVVKIDESEEGIAAANAKEKETEKGEESKYVYGTIEDISAGDVVITASTINGIEREILLRVVEEEDTGSDTERSLLRKTQAKR